MPWHTLNSLSLMCGRLYLLSPRILNGLTLRVNRSNSRRNLAQSLPKLTSPTPCYFGARTKATKTRRQFGICFWQNNSIQTVATVNWQPCMDTLGLKIRQLENYNAHSILIPPVRVSNN